MRLLFGVSGSAGDLFPLVPVATALVADGHEVRWVTPRGLGLYLRSTGWTSSTSLGLGEELKVITDRQLFTTDFNGWRSWRRTIDQYVAPTLDADVKVVCNLINLWFPDAVVTSGFAVAVRIAAALTGTPNCELSIYPQHARLATQFKFCHIARRTVAALAGTADPQHVSRLLWGSPPDVLLHDPMLLGYESKAIGFPYWDDLEQGDAIVNEILEWLHDRSEPAVLCTLGSFVGLNAPNAWIEILKALQETDVRALIIGANSRTRADIGERHPQHKVSAFVPLSRVLAPFRVAIHHGGIGTTYGAIRAGVPAVVLPQAFDQTFNAQLVETAGCGLNASRLGLTASLARAISDSNLKSQTVAMSRVLIDPEEAVRAAVAKIAAFGSLQP